MVNIVFAPEDDTKPPYKYNLIVDGERYRVCTGTPRTMLDFVQAGVRIAAIVQEEIKEAAHDEVAAGYASNVLQREGYLARIREAEYRAADGFVKLAHIPKWVQRIFIPRDIREPNYLGGKNEGK